MKKSHHACLHVSNKTSSKVKKFFFLTDSKRRVGVFADSVREWIERWMAFPIVFGQACRTGDLRFAKSFKRNEDILVASVREMLNYGIENIRDWLSQIKVIVVLNVPEVIFPDVLSASALFSSDYRCC
jgi:hypothetical protein